ncbi:hypothetical protein QWA68_016938, partial [Fusarium oxysporum]
RWQD